MDDVLGHKPATQPLVVIESGKATADEQSPADSLEDGDNETG